MTGVQSNTLKKRIRRYIPIYLIMLPGMFYLLINNYLPMAGLVIAFKKFSFRKGIFGSDWNGLKNFEFLFRTKDAWIITRNTLLYNVAFILIGTMVAIFVAVLLSEVKKKNTLKVYQTSILLPHLVSWVIISYIVYELLAVDVGILNRELFPLLGIEKVSWYTDTTYWPFILVFLYIWKITGYNSIIYLSSILGISEEYYEAAVLDGATKMQQVFKITLPLLKPTIVTMFILNIGRIFYADFGLFYQIPMNSGALNSVTQVLDTYVYRGLLELGDVGMSAAAGFYQSVVGFFMVIASNLVVRKLSAEDALF